jgi:hypothetical protein
MEVAVCRSHVADPGTWLRQSSQAFVLTAEVRFSQEERWAIEAHNLYHHVIFDRTPPWYLPAFREAERSKERAERDGVRFEWPWFVPLAVPVDWIVTVAGLLASPVFAVSFNTAAELAEFEPRMLGAFARFKRFLDGYDARPQTTYWRF